MLWDDVAEIVHTWWNQLDSKNLLANSDTLQIKIYWTCAWRGLLLEKSFLTKNDCHFNFIIFIYPYVCLSVCIGFPNHIQSEANMHFNTLLFSTLKAVITCAGNPVSTAYWQFLFIWHPFTQSLIFFETTLFFVRQKSSSFNVLECLESHEIFK